MNRYRRCAGINETPVEDELFLVVGDSGDIFHLDRMALPIWRALEQPGDQAELQALFEQAFPDVPGDTIARDLAQALDILLKGAVIELCD